MPINNCAWPRCKRHVIMEIFRQYNPRFSAYYTHMRMALTLNVSIEFGIACRQSTMYAHFHPLCAHMFVLNSWIMDSRIQFNSIQLNMDNGYIRFRSGSFFFSLWLTLALFQSRDGTYAHRLRTLTSWFIISYFWVLVTGNIFVHKMSHQLCVRAFYCGCIRLEMGFSSFSANWSRDGRHWLNL